MTGEHTSLQIKKTCKKCGKKLDISNFANYKDTTYSPEDYCKDCEKLIAAAKDLEELIDIYGFGAEFSATDLYKYFENELVANSKVKLLMEYDLLVKNQLTDNYHFSDIVTCNSFIKENRVEPATDGDYDFKEILTPLDEKYVNNFNPKQMNQSGIAWISYNGVTWTYQRNIKNNTITFSESDIFKLHETVIKHNQPWGVSDFNIAEKFLKNIYSPFIETSQDTGILNPLPGEYESRFNPTQASKTGIAWVSIVADSFYYQRNVNGKHVSIKNENIYELYKEVVNNNLMWGIRDYNKAKKYIKLPDDFDIPEKPKKSKKPKKIIKTNNKVIVSYSRTKKDEIDVEINGKIKSNELNNMLDKLNFFMIDVEKMELNKIKGQFDVSIRLNINIALLNKFEDTVNELGWEIN